MTANADPDDPLLDALNRIADDADAGPSKVDQANLRHAPRLLDLTQLTVKVHYNTDQATITAGLPAHPDSITSIGDTAAQHTCAGGAECASCECPRTGSSEKHSGGHSGRRDGATLSGFTSIDKKPLVISALVPLIMKRRKPLSADT